MVIKKRKPVSGLALSGRSIGEVLSEYQQLSEQIKFMEERKKELAESIKSYAIEVGKKDSKGSYFSEDGDLVYGRVAKCSIKLNEDRAKEYFKKKGLWKDVSKTVLDEDKVDMLVSTGDITSKEIEPLCDVKESYQVSVTRKKAEEEMPEVEVSPPTGGRKLFRRR